MSATVVRVKLACLLGKLQKRVFSKLSQAVVMSCCMAGKPLCDIRPVSGGTCVQDCRGRNVGVSTGEAAKSCRHTLHTSLHSLYSHFSLYTPHSTLYTLHSILHTLHSTLYTCTLHSTLYSQHFTLHTPPSTVHTSHSTLYTLHATLHTLHSTLSTLRFTLYTPHTTHYTPHSPLYTLHPTLYTLHSTLYTPHSTFHTLHSTLHTLHSTLHTLHSTLHFPLYTPHSTVHTLHSTLHILHSTRHTPHFTLHTLLHTLHFTLHTMHPTLHTLHSTLYTPHSTSTFDSGSPYLRFLQVICIRVHWLLLFFQESIRSIPFPVSSNRFPCLFPSPLESLESNATVGFLPLFSSSEQVQAFEFDGYLISCVGGVLLGSSVVFHTLRQVVFKPRMGASTARRCLLCGECCYHLARQCTITCFAICKWPKQRHCKQQSILTYTFITPCFPDKLSS